MMSQLHLYSFHKYHLHHQGFENCSSMVALIFILLKYWSVCWSTHTFKCKTVEHPVNLLRTVCICYRIRSTNVDRCIQSLRSLLAGMYGKDSFKGNTTCGLFTTIAIFADSIYMVCHSENTIVSYYDVSDTKMCGYSILLEAP